ncbi:MAG: hypothetical protein CMF19_07405 [Idiomarinaceae bacterium]|nr:hypothetical protein [Idiomarinaceae bacterium]|tara:strand:- start:36 stop:248 length:213 start_codon:yes stop_codon:yes gene_type:complete
MTFSITSKTAKGDLNEFVLSDGTTTVFVSHPSDVADEQVIQEQDDFKAYAAEVEAEERRIQAEIEENVNG